MLMEREQEIISAIESKIQTCTKNSNSRLVTESAWSKGKLSGLIIARETAVELTSTIQQLREERDKYKWEDEQFTWLQEQIKVGADEIRAVMQENERLKEVLEKIASAYSGYDAMNLKNRARKALKGE